MIDLAAAVAVRLIGAASTVIDLIVELPALVATGQPFTGIALFLVVAGAVTAGATSR